MVSKQLFLALSLAALAHGISGSVLKKRSTDYNGYMLPDDYPNQDAEEVDEDTSYPDAWTSSPPPPLPAPVETWPLENNQEPPEPQSPTATDNKPWHHKIAYGYKHIREGLGEAGTHLNHLAKKGWNWLSTSFGEEDARDLRQTAEAEAAAASINSSEDYPVWV